MGSVAAIVNQKGGVGKTTVTLGLTSAAMAAGKRVLVVDLDPQGSSTWILGHDPNQVVCSTAEVLHDASAAEAILASSWSDRIHLLPSSNRLQPRDTATHADRLAEALAEVRARYHAVLLDCPPSLGSLTLNGLTAADHAVIVVELSALSLRGIGAVADVVDEVWDAHNPRLDLAGVIVNRVPAVSGEADRRLDELARIVGRSAIWEPFVPQRVIINQAVGERRPIHSYGARAGDVPVVFDQLWRRLRKVLKR
jgi:cellulose biosynthesis protein BcsQ